MKNIAILLLLAFSFTAYSQNVKRSYKVLEKKEYEKAKELFQKNLEENPESAAANFGMALILADEKGSYFDILDAWDYTMKANNNKNTLSQEDLEVIGEYFINTEVRKTSYPVKKKIEFAIEAIESRLIKYIREENDLEAVYELLDRYPDFRHYDNVVHIRNQFEYRKYERQNTLEAYREFMEKFPEAAQITKVKKNIAKLAFDEVKQQNTLDAYNNYITAYPKSDYVQTAIRLRNSAAYRNAKEKNTIEALDVFIKNYPDALEIADAKKNRKELVYEQAMAIKSLDAYNDFIREYPDGKYYVDIFNLKSASLGKSYQADIGLSTEMIKWTRAFDYKSGNDTATAIAQTADGGFLIAGETRDPDKKFTDAWLVKMDGNGVMQWNKLVGNEYNDKVTHIFSTSTGDIICLGYTQAYENDSLPNGWMFKLTAEGKKIWNKNLGDIKLLALNMNINDRIFISSVPNDLADTIVPNYFIQSFTKDGKKNWEREYVMNGFFNDIDFTYDHNILLTGSKWFVLLDDKKYVLFDKLIEGNKTAKLALIDPSKNITYCAEDSTHIQFATFTATGLDKWNFDVTKVDASHTVVELLNAKNNIYSFENSETQNIIRKISMQGNRFPEILYDSRYKLVKAIYTVTGDVVLLLENKDLIVLCLQLP